MRAFFAIFCFVHVNLLISFLRTPRLQDTAESLKARVQALEGAAFIEAVRSFAAQTLPMSQQQQH